MDDLSNYRARVGCFTPGQSSTILQYSSSSTPNLRGVLAYTVAFLLISGLIMEATINDPGIELNPGPTKTTIQFTQSESIIMRNKKKLSTNIARISSHRFFNKSCLDLQLTPKTLYHEITHTPAKPNPKLLSKLQQMKNSYTADALRTYNQHYTEVIAASQSAKTVLLNELNSICKTPNRRDTLLAIISSHYDHHISKF